MNGFYRLSRLSSITVAGIPLALVSLCRALVGWFGGLILVFGW